MSKRYLDVAGIEKVLADLERDPDMLGASERILGVWQSICQLESAEARRAFQERYRAVNARIAVAQARRKRSYI